VRAGRPRSWAVVESEQIAVDGGGSGCGRDARGPGVQLSAPAGVLAGYLGQTAVTFQVASRTRCHPWARRVPQCPVSSGGFRVEKRRRARCFGGPYWRPAPVDPSLDQPVGAWLSGTGPRL
jgi:hypothetical protein